MLRRYMDPTFWGRGVLSEGQSSSGFVMKWNQLFIGRHSQKLYAQVRGLHGSSTHRGRAWQNSVAPMVLR